MTTEKKVNKVGLVAVVAVFTLLPMGLLGALLGGNNRLTGFAWGIGIGIALFVAMAVGMFGWEWIKKEADKGKLFPYMIGGIIAAVAVSGLLAINLGKPSCEDTGDAPYSSCTQYADDGFEASSRQRLDKFWGTLPVTIIIGLLVAYIVHGQREKNRPKHFRSEKDRFMVDIFPETIGVELDEDGNSYKYRPYEDLQYLVDVVPLEDFKTDQHKVVESWHRQIVSAATKVSAEAIEYSEGEKESATYLYSSHSLKKGFTYHHLTMTKYEKIYSLTMYIRASEHASKTDLDKTFFEFVSSFHFI